MHACIRRERGREEKRAFADLFIFSVLKYGGANVCVLTYVVLSLPECWEKKKVRLR